MSSSNGSKSIRDMATYLKVMEWLQNGTKFNQECAKLTLDVIAELRKNNDSARTFINTLNSEREMALQIIIRSRHEIMLMREVLEELALKGNVQAQQVLTQLSNEIIGIEG